MYDCVISGWHQVIYTYWLNRFEKIYVIDFELKNKYNTFANHFFE